MKKTVREQRRATRLTRLVPIDCTLDAYPQDLINEKHLIKRGDGFRAKTINVSKTGMLLNLNYLFPERTTLDIKVPAGEATPIQFTMKVRVAWTKKNAYRIFGRYSAGVRIISGEKKFIKKLVDFFELPL